MLMCARGEYLKRKRRQEEKARRNTEVPFQVYGRPLVTVSEFRYLGWFMTASDDGIG